MRKHKPVTIRCIIGERSYKNFTKNISSHMVLEEGEVRKSFIAITTLLSYKCVLTSVLPHTESLKFQQLRHKGSNSARRKTLERLAYRNMNCTAVNLNGSKIYQDM